MDIGNWVKFRIEQLEFVDVGPIRKGSQDANTISPFTIGLVVGFAAKY